jgi:hypothetical protein
MWDGRAVVEAPVPTWAADEAVVYTLEGYAISMEDGSEQHLDDHQITVR